MANVTQGLFGFDPSQVAQQQMDALQQRSMQYGQMNPVQAARAQLYKAGSQLGDASASFMGVKDPELEAKALMQKTAATLNLNDHAAVRAVANQWLQSGNPTLQNKALQLNEVADKAEESFNQRTREKAAIDLASRKAERQQAFSKEYAEAPDADARLAVTRKYADMPDLIKLDEASLARKEKAAEAAQARADKSQERRDSQEALFAQQRFLAGENARNRASASKDSKYAADSLKATALQEKVNNTNEKAADMDAKAAKGAATSISHADQMIADAKDAKGLVKFETTGRTGQGAAAINPGGEAGTLRNRIATIKANLGFDRLQRMREDSPTGGALGQVAVQELEALQSSVGSLSPMQSDAELKRNFDKVIKHYEGWKGAIVQDEAARNKRRAGPQSINIPGAIARNPAVKPTANGWGAAVEH